LELLQQAIDIAYSAGKLLAAESQRPDGPRGHGDKADVDVEIEQLLRDELLALFDCDFWGEETGSTLTGHQYCWAVDPNDGTSDFLKGHRGSAISIGLLCDWEPALGVVYAPVTQSLDADLIAWESGRDGLLRNGQEIHSSLERLSLAPDSTVLVSVAARTKPAINAELCAPAGFYPMPSIAYRLARAAAGDAVAGMSLVPVGAHDVVAGHALVLGAGGVLLDQSGRHITYRPPVQLSHVSDRCFGGAPRACLALQQRDWARLFQT